MTAVRLLLLAMLAVAIFSRPVSAAEGVPDKYAPLIEQAKKDGLTVIVIAPPARTEEQAKPMPDDMAGIGLALREEVRRLVMSAGDIPFRMTSALEIVSPEGSYRWLLIAVATALAGIFAGFLATRITVKWSFRTFRPWFSDNPADDSQRIGLLLFRSAVATFNTLLLFAIAMLVAIVFDTGNEPARRTILIIVAGYCAWRFVRYVLAQNLLAPDLPRHRMLAITDAEAAAILADFKWVMAVAISVLTASAWLVSLDLDADANKLLLIAASLIAAGLIGYVILRHRSPIGRAILGYGPPEEKPAWRRALAAGWHVLGLAYVAAATAVTIVRLLLNLPSANLLSAAPLIALFAAIGTYGVLYLAIEGIYRSRRMGFERRRALLAEAAREVQDGGRPAEESLPGTAKAVVTEPGNAAAGEPPRFSALFRPLAHRAAALGVTLLAATMVANAWGLRGLDGGWIGATVLKTLGVAFAAWIGWRAVNIAIAAKLEAEGDMPPSGVPDDEDATAIRGRTRLGTILPLVRVVLLAVIVTVAAMIALSSLGVDVAPLFAGAGVVGLAVGFGAQALIRDIFSGFFFLIDDAFRVGEYVEMGDMKGTVEKISLRSFQLRHHNGPLHTVPFGEIKQLTNHSRDWVIMKLPLRLTFDTDVERVRKLLKKLGQSLLSHPEIGGNFLQPLKSQGVVEIDDSALVLRVKFMTRPDEQWVTRKVVYAAIQELFRKEGIRFANREVTVRISGDSAADPETRAKAAAAGAQSALAASQGASKPPLDD
jgi:small-conductance mechanosensitive channel